MPCDAPEIVDMSITCRRVQFPLEMCRLRFKKCRIVLESRSIARALIAIVMTFSDDLVDASSSRL